jgi:hypothetical protein
VENIIHLFTKQANFLRRSTVQSLPPQLVFPAWTFSGPCWTRFLWLMNGPHKLECYNPTGLERLGSDKLSSWLGPFVIWLSIWLHSQHFIFLATYGWARYAEVLLCPRLEKLANDKWSSLFGPFVIYRENKVLWIWL